MKRFLSKFLNLITKTVLIINRVNKKILLVLDFFKNLINLEECQNYHDNLLLYKAKNKQPAISERKMEYPWMINEVKKNINSGKILDVGSTTCDLLFELLPKSIEIHGIDLNDKKFVANEIKFKLGDIRKTNYEDNFFDCVACISTLEHIGVPGRYNSDEDLGGDKKAMSEIKRILKINGLALITFPYGKNDVLPLNRLYNKDRVQKLFDGFDIIEEKFIKFNKKWGLWLEITEVEASQAEMLDDWYAVALIKAKKKQL